MAEQVLTAEAVCSARNDVRSRELAHSWGTVSAKEVVNARARELSLLQDVERCHFQGAATDHQEVMDAIDNLKQELKQELAAFQTWLNVRLKADEMRSQARNYNAAAVLRETTLMPVPVPMAAAAHGLEPVLPQPPDGFPETRHALEDRHVHELQDLMRAYGEQPPPQANKQELLRLVGNIIGVRMT